MKLFDGGRAPNPRRVRIYLAEKGIEVPRQRVALAEGAHKAPAFLAKNSLGQVPALELDDGTVIAESVAICRYFEALHPEPPLFGATPAEVGIVEMWLRRIELRLMAPLGQVWTTSTRSPRRMPSGWASAASPISARKTASAMPTRCAGWAARSPTARSSPARRTRWPTSSR